LVETLPTPTRPVKPESHAYGVTSKRHPAGTVAGGADGAALAALNAACAPADAVGS
jgi:hypothetical protein